MAIRKQRATTVKEIVELDISIAIKKAKARYRSEKEFYILKYNVCDEEFYFASGYPEKDRITGEEIYYQKWVFNEQNKRWVEDV